MPVVSARLPASVMALLCSSLLASCNDGPTDPGGSYRIAIAAGDQQVGPVLAQLSVPLVVRVLDAEDRPAPGVRIAWSVDESGGFISTASSPSITDSQGFARVHRTLGRHAGEHVTTASVGPGEAVHFTSFAQVQGATQIALSLNGHGNLQRDTVLATLSPFRVRVSDQNDAPVEGVTVSWAAFYTGSVSPSASMTDANGIAEATYTLGPNAGPGMVRASVFGLEGSPVSFGATADAGSPTRISLASGSGQLGAVNQVVGRYEVQVTDAHDNPVRGVLIEWKVTEGGGAIDPERSITGSDGPDSAPRASTVHTLGPADGTQSVTATAVDIPGAPSATFESTAVSAIVLSGGWYGDSFSPDEVVVPVGGTVAWVWSCEDWYGWYGCSHDVVFEDDPTEPVSSGKKASGTHTRTFADAGVYRYRCTVHSTSFTQGMVGTVRVE
jgi:plastocyanin